SLAPCRRPADRTPMSLLYKERPARALVWRMVASAGATAGSDQRRGGTHARAAAGAAGRLEPPGYTSGMFRQGRTAGELEALVGEGEGAARRAGAHGSLAPGGRCLPHSRPEPPRRGLAPLRVSSAIRRPSPRFSRPPRSCRPRVGDLAMAERLR